MVGLAPPIMLQDLIAQIELEVCVVSRVFVPQVVLIVLVVLVASAVLVVSVVQ